MISNGVPVGASKSSPNRFRRQVEQVPSSKRKRCSVASRVAAAVTAVVVTSLLLTQGFQFMMIFRQLDQVSQYIQSSTPLWFDNHTDVFELMTDASSSSITRTIQMFATTTTNESVLLENDKSQQQYNPPPPLSKLISGRQQQQRIVGDVQFVLNFAVIGYAKCGTTTFVQWMQEHDETLILPNENYALRSGRPWELVQRLYQLQPRNITVHPNNNRRFVTHYKNITFQRGYKNPSDVQRKSSMQLMRTYFPETKLIVGVRHPILWFESFYNYRIQGNPTPDNPTMPLMPHPNQLIGACRRSMHQACTDSGLFHVYLANLGKTNLTDEELDDESLQGHRDKILENDTAPEPMPNPIFLYEINQLKQPRLNSSRQQQERSLQFRRDVQAFLQLQYRLPPIPHSLPDRVWDDPQVQAYRDSQKIDICDDEYLRVRRRLLKQSQEASVWIRKYFLDAPGVFVSSRGYLEVLLQRWMYDPCDTTTTTTTPTTINSTTTQS